MCKEKRWNETGKEFYLKNPLQEEKEMSKGKVLGMPIKGKVVPITDVPDPVFSEKMMEEIVFPPTKRIFDHIRSRGVCLELHSCGHIERFIPYMLDLKVDLLQIQARCNDIAAYKRKWGDRVGFDVSVFPAPGATKEELVEDIRRAVDDYGAGGGFYSSVFAEDPELVWTGASELFYYSREKYDAEREAKKG